jgi:hypothetical protein
VRKKTLKPLYYYELNAEAAKRGYNNEQMANIAAISTSSYSLKKNGHCPWLLSECMAYCVAFKRSLYGFFIDGNSIE